MKKDYTSDDEIDRIRKILELMKVKKGDETKSDVISLTCVFEKCIKVSINEFDINPLYSVSVRGYNWQCGLKFTDINFQTFQDNELILLLEYNIRCGISSIMGERYLKSVENENLEYIDANLLYGSQCLNYYFMMKLNLIEILN